jgi:hypothetical protein
VRVIYKKFVGRKNISAENIFRKNSSAKQFFRPKEVFGLNIFRPKTYCRMEKIRPTKFLHVKRGCRHCTVRFDVPVFGRKNTFRPKKYISSVETMFSDFCKSDCHESVTHLRDFTLYKRLIFPSGIFSR